MHGKCNATILNVVQETSKEIGDRFKGAQYRVCILDASECSKLWKGHCSQQLCEESKTGYPDILVSVDMRRKCREKGLLVELKLRVKGHKNRNKIVKDIVDKFDRVEGTLRSYKRCVVFPSKARDKAIERHLWKAKIETLWVECSRDSAKKIADVLEVDP